MVLRACMAFHYAMLDVVERRESLNDRRIDENSQPVWDSPLDVMVTMVNSFHLPSTSSSTIDPLKMVSYMFRSFFFLFICLSNSLSLVGCTAKWKNQKKKIKKKREKKRRESVLLLKRKKKTRIYRIKKILRMLISETRYSLFASDACPNITHCALLSFPFGLAPIIA